MPRTHLRSLLLASAAAMTLPAFAAHAQSVSAIPGGGSSLAAVDYAGPLAPTNAIPTSPSEFFTWNNGPDNTFTPADQLQYFTASSGRGQNAFSTDNPANFGYTGTTPLPSYVAFAASDAFLASVPANGYPQTINGFTFNSATSVTYPLLKTQDGALIQIPFLGLGITVPAASGNKAVKTNGSLKLTDADLCGIFSGTINSWGNISLPLSGLTGQIDVYFRGDSSGTTFLLTNHLKAACAGTSTFTAGQLALMPTTSFSSLFGGSNPALPSNFTAETGSAGVAEALAGTVTTSGGTTVNNPGDPQGVGYLSTDYTDISKAGAANTISATAPDTGFINSKKLYTSAVEGTGESSFLTPTVANITTGLAHAGTGSAHAKPPTGAAASNPLNWIPSIPTVKSGYAIVGYTNLILAQCYNNSANSDHPNAAAGLVSFIGDHLSQSKSSPYYVTASNNGFTIPGVTFANAIKADFLTSGSKLAIADAGTAGTCASVTGR